MSHITDNLTFLIDGSDDEMAKILQEAKDRIEYLESTMESCRGLMMKHSAKASPAVFRLLSISSDENTNSYGTTIEQEENKLSDTWPWTKTDNGYCSEISDLSAGGAVLDMENRKMPGTDMLFDIKAAQEHRNTDNEITHWTMTIEGTVYTVFND